MTFNQRAAGLTNRMVLLAMIPSAFVYAVLDYLGDGGRAVAAAAALYVMIGSFRFFWDLRGQLWFLITMLIVAAIHAALVLTIPWSNGPYQVPLLALLFPAMVLDFLTIYMVIRLEETAITESGS